MIHPLLFFFFSLSISVDFPGRMWEQDERLKCAGMQSTQQDEDEETAGLMCVEATEFEFNSGFKELWEDREIDIYYCITLFFW